jgi:hypothetical protein
MVPRVAMFPFKRKIVLPGEAGVKAGDIIGYSGNGWISTLVNVGTYGWPHWSISHVGVLANAPDGRLLLFESTQLDGLPCEITGEVFLGTQAHQLDHVLKVYDGKAWQYPLYRSLYPNEDERLTEFLMETLHTPYDKMGAFRSAGVGLSWIESLFREQDLHTIFCSEMVAAAYSVVGLSATDNVSRWNPNRLIRHLRHREILCKPRRLK